MAQKMGVSVGRLSPVFQLPVHADRKNRQPKYFFKGIPGWKKDATGWKEYKFDSI